jgi:hypothetical protein
VKSVFVWTSNDVIALFGAALIIVVFAVVNVAKWIDERERTKK